MPGDFIADDLGAFFATSEFADTAARADASTFPCIFDRAYVDPLGVASHEPRILCAATVAPVRGELLTLPGDALGAPTASYRVATVEPDGAGLVECRLEHA